MCVFLQSCTLGHCYCVWPSQISFSFLSSNHSDNTQMIPGSTQAKRTCISQQVLPNQPEWMLDRWGRKLLKRRIAHFKQPKFNTTTGVPRAAGHSDTQLVWRLVNILHCRHSADAVTRQYKAETLSAGQNKLILVWLQQQEFHFYLPFYIQLPYSDYVNKCPAFLHLRWLTQFQQRKEKQLSGLFEAFLQLSQA